MGISKSTCSKPTSLPPNPTPCAPAFHLLVTLPFQVLCAECGVALATFVLPQPHPPCRSLLTLCWLSFQRTPRIGHCYCPPISLWDDCCCPSGLPASTPTLPPSVPDTAARGPCHDPSETQAPPHSQEASACMGPPWGLPPSHVTLPLSLVTLLAPPPLPQAVPSAPGSS